MHTEWTPELEAALAAPFPDSCHKQLEKKSNKTGKVTYITYVTWTDYVLRLNDMVGVNGWEEDVSWDEAGGKLICTIKLTVLGITKANVGDEEEAKSGYGTACTNAYSQAFRRTCALFGLGMYLYYDKSGAGKNSGRKAPTANSDANPSSNSPTPLPLDGSFVIPKGEHEGKRIDDPSIPISYLIPTADKMPPKYRSIYQAEIDRRHAEARTR